MQRLLLRLVSPTIVLIGWALASWAGLVSALILPPPTRVAAELGHLIASGELARALGASLYRVVSGFLVAIMVGVVLGATMARVRLIDELIDPIVELLRPVSPLALFPVAILWLGLGDASKIFIIALAASFPVILNTYAGVRGIDPNFFRASRSLGANPVEVFLGIVLPGSLPQIFTGIRLAWGISLIVIIAAEMVGSTTGIGYMVLEAQQTFRTERVFAGIVVIGGIGFATDVLFRYLHRVFLPSNSGDRVE
jgi:ABC-type nitrate/sulfonate/bicarbonate transport system permease component